VTATLTGMPAGAAPTQPAGPDLRLVLASHNAKKLAELQGLLEALPLDLVSSAQLDIGEPDEPHATFLENALAKARHAARASGGAALADDSGLCVDALGGAPGVVSAHYAALPDDVLSLAPEHADLPPRERRRRAQDAANNARLLADLAALGSPARRTAAFVSTLVALRHADDPEPLVAVGRWPGVILDTPRGCGGFGYDPLVWVPSLGASVAELGSEVKNRHSHRALAAAQLVRLMREAWSLG
jgi:XTP/dITP diphosphohydrolase